MTQSGRTLLSELQRLAPLRKITFGNKSQKADFFALEHLPVGAGH
jgi:hypothetical protein